MTKITRPTTGALPLNLATAFVGMLFLFVLVTTVITPAGNATGTTVTLSADNSSVTSGGAVVLTASMPLSEYNGSVAQTLVQTINPAFTHLTSVEDIVAPAGWTVEYSFDQGSTWTSTAPTTDTGSPTSWDMVSAVKAVGTVISEGSSNGQQKLIGQGSLSTPVSGSFTSASSGGDGWGVTFDDAGNVYNVNHHTTLRVLCHTRSGTSCGPGWPITNSILNTSMNAPAWVDNTHHHLWASVKTLTGSTYGTSSGFVCIDVSNLAVGPTFCGGSYATAYKNLGAGWSTNFAGPMGLTNVGEELYQWSPTGQIECLNMVATNGAGAPCAGQPYTFSQITYSGLSYNSSTTSAWAGKMINVDGKVYGDGASAAPFGGPAGSGTAVPTIYAICFDPATHAACTGWSTPQALPGASLTTLADYAYRLPDASGATAGVCFQRFDANVNNATCYAADGSTVSQDSGLANAMVAATWNGAYTSDVPVEVGSRVYWTAGVGTLGANTINCWDTVTDAICTGGWPISTSNPTFGFSRGAAYTIAIDPENSSCLWKNDNQSVIGSFNVYATSDTVCGPSPDAVFTAASIVPRLGCSMDNALTGWGNFTLTSPPPAGYTTATLTVFDTAGNPISAYSNIAQSGTDQSGNPVFDLSGLAIATSGQRPEFHVNLAGRTSTADIAASLEAIGSTPQLCLTLQAPTTTCQTTLGPLSLNGWAYAPTAYGDYTEGSGTVQTLDSVTTDLSTPALAEASCGNTLSGTALTSGSAAVSGVTVSLLDGSGAPITVNGTPVTTTTDGSGNYTFGYLAPGTYRVSFADGTSDTVDNANTISGATGTVTGVSSASNAVAQSLDASVDIATPAVVDAVYTHVVTTTTTIAPTTTTTEAPTTTTTKPGLAFTGIDVPRQLTSMLLLFATGGLFLALVRRRILRGH
jgi:hypothetical protein